MTFNLNMAAKLDASDVARGAAEAKQAVASIGSAYGIAGSKAAAATGLATHEITNLTYQLNDVATMLVSGQSPFLIMMQQGTQVSQIMGRRGLGQILPALSAGLSSLLTPTTLVLGGVTALGFGAAEVFSAIRGDVQSVDDVLAKHDAAIRKLKDAYDEAGKGAREYAHDSLDVLNYLGGRNIKSLQEKLRGELSDLLQGNMFNIAAAQPGPFLGGASFFLSGDKGSTPYADLLRQLREEAQKTQPDIRALRAEIAAIANDSSASEAVRTFGDRLLESTSKAFDLTQAIYETRDAMAAFSREGKIYADALAKLSGGDRTYSPRERAAQDYQAALKHAGDNIMRIQAQNEYQARLDRIAEQERLAEAKRAKPERKNPALALLDAQNGTLEMLKLEAALMGATAAQRAKAIALLDAEIEIRKRGVDVNSQYAETIRKNAEETANWRLENERLKDGFEAVESSGVSMIDTMLNKLRGGDLSGLLQSLGDELMNLTSMLAIANPLKNALYGKNLPTLSTVGGGSGLFSILFGGGFSDGGISAMIPGYTPGFDIGGWTGDGNPSRVAGYVHKEEFVVRAGAAKKHRPMLEAINRGGDPGYFEGGIVGRSYGSGGATPGSAAGGGRGAGNVYVKIEDHAGVSVGQRSETNSDGDQMLTFVLDKVGGAIADGQFDNSFRRYNGGQVRGTRR